MADDNQTPEEEQKNAEANAADETQNDSGASDPSADETLAVTSPGSAKEEANTTRLQRQKKLSLQADESTEIAPQSPEETKSPDETQATSIVDPTRRRDTNTASLRRLQPSETDDAAGDTEDPDNTETVNIKVIKDQKKQFKNMMTSSQTLRVKPEDAEKQPELAQSAQQPEQEGGGDERKGTLKIKAPAADTRTESIQRPGPDTTAPAAATQKEEAPAPKAGGTLKIKSPGQGQGQAAATGQTEKKSTLKIKAPPASAPAQGQKKAGGTLKIKAPAAAQTQAAPAPTAGETVKQEAPPSGGRTVKLRQGKKPGEAAQRRKARRPAADEEMADIDEAATPGVLHTIVSVAALVAVGVTIFLTWSSANQLFETPW